MSYANRTVTTEVFQAEMDSQVEQRADKALRSIEALRRELDDAEAGVKAWAKGEAGIRPAIHHQRTADATNDVQAFELTATFAAEHRNHRFSS